MLSPCSEHFLDWFHITMRLTVLGQYVRGLMHHDRKAAEEFEALIEQIKWHLWHGNCRATVRLIQELVEDLELLENGYPRMKKFAVFSAEFLTYIVNNASSIPSYGERWRYGERISTAFVESAVNVVVGKRFAKKQQMQWSRQGAHLLLQAWTKTLNGELRAMFERWYPAMAANDQHSSTRTSA